MLLFVRAEAQETRASLSGTVTDPSQAAIAGAVVRLTNSNTGVTFDVTTNAAGQYRFLFLIPGEYTLKIEAQGFRQFERTGLALQVGQSAEVDAALQVGSMTETVTVTSSAALLRARASFRGTRCIVWRRTPRSTVGFSATVQRKRCG